MRAETISHLFYQSPLKRPRLDHADGIYLWDQSGKRYIDASSGPMVSNIGHSNPRVLSAMKTQMDKGTFAYPVHFENDAAVALAKMTASLLPESLDRVFFTSGGSETIESCLKLARQYALAKGEPDRWKVISLFPSYHGSTLGAVSVTGMTPFSEPFGPMMAKMPKIPAPCCYLNRELGEQESALRFAENLRDEIICQGPESVLAFIMEPIGGASTGALVAPDAWHRRIQEICREFGVLLILDEVMTGFRVSLGGAQGHYGITPDLTTLGKVIGGGMPVGAFGGKREIMEHIAPLGPVYQAGTLSGNPVAMAAGLKTLELISQPDFFANLTAKTEKLVNGILAAAKAANIPMTANTVGGMFGLFFSEEERINSFYQVCNCNQDRFKLFFHGMLNQGVYLAPSAFETGFVSAAHTDEDLDKTIAAAAEVFASL